MECRPPSEKLATKVKPVTPCILAELANYYTVALQGWELELGSWSPRLCSLGQLYRKLAFSLALADLLAANFPESKRLEGRSFDRDGPLSFVVGKKNTCSSGTATTVCWVTALCRCKEI